LGAVAIDGAPRARILSNNGMSKTPADNGLRLTSLLTALGQEYRHLRSEHARERIGGATRHRLEVRMERLKERFQRLLRKWVAEETLEHAWLMYLHEGGARPSAPSVVTPPLFRGLTEAGSFVEVRASSDGACDVLVDGAVERHERVAWQIDPDVVEPIQIGQHRCREIICDAPAEAVGALAAFLATERSHPPWQWLRTLFEEGLVDGNFGLTPRGHRQLRRFDRGTPGTPSSITFGIVAADRARARLLILHAKEGEHAATLAPLVEVFETTHPDHRARDADLLADTRPGLRRDGSQGPRHAVSDRRERRRRAHEQRFATDLTKEALALWHSHGVNRGILIASPAMLGALRYAMRQASHGSTPWSMREAARDLTRLSTPALHDLLAADGLLPARGRIPPRVSVPGLPCAAR
jgi:protein required for attachment to host cells